MKTQNQTSSWIDALSNVSENISHLSKTLQEALAPSDAPFSYTLTEEGDDDKNIRDYKAEARAYEEPIIPEELGVILLAIEGCVKLGMEITDHLKKEQSRALTEPLLTHEAGSADEAERKIIGTTNPLPYEPPTPFRKR